MAKINLGERLNETIGAPTKADKKKIFFPTLHISEKLPKGFDVGQSINGSFKGKITSISESSTEKKESASFVIEVMSIDMKKGKISEKEFEGMTDKEQEEVLDKDKDK